jgi:hypothetical protein
LPPPGIAFGFGVLDPASLLLDAIESALARAHARSIRAAALRYQEFHPCGIPNAIA